MFDMFKPNNASQAAQPGVNASNATAKAASNATAKAASNATAKAASNASGNVLTSGVGTDLMSKMKDFMKKNSLVLIFIGAILVIFIIVIIYIYYAMKNGGLVGKVLMPQPIKLDGTTSAPSISGDGIPIPSVGREYTYSFWTYLENYTQTPGSQKMLWYRGSPDDISSANPIVYLDSLSNTMYFVIKTQNSVLSSATVNYNSDVGLVVPNNYFLNPNFNLADDSNKHIILSIDYVPLQRWVNTTLIISDKLITIYLDGEIYSVKSIDEYKNNKASEFDVNGNKVNYNLIIDNTVGDIYVGKSPMTSKNITINGYMSKLEFFNYGISSSDVKSVYNDGPFPSGILAALGAGGYAVRSPVYKLSASVN
jgi:hypothetical protein